jgi:hypothetical protein
MGILYQYLLGVGFNLPAMLDPFVVPSTDHSMGHLVDDIECTTTFHAF